MKREKKYTLREVVELVFQINGVFSPNMGDIISTVKSLRSMANAYPEKLGLVKEVNEVLRIYMEEKMLHGYLDH